MNYGVKRREALNKWLKESGRKRIGLTDIFHDGFECNWQQKATEHISLFCSLGQFSTNITDLLTDLRYDRLSYSTDKNDQIILRQYSKLMLIISEVLDDLKHTYRIATGVSDSVAKQRLSNPLGLNIDNVTGFINNVCKHKCKGFHVKNHHIPLCFADAGGNCCNGNVLDINCVGKTKCEGDIDTIFIPRLDDLIDCVTYAYQQLDKLFIENEEAFNKICTKFSKETITV